VVPTVSAGVKSGTDSDGVIHRQKRGFIKYLPLLSDFLSDVLSKLL
jgi:hypothetical protein